MKIVIVENPAETIVAVVDDWQGPIPRVGEYIYHPPFDNDETPSNVMSVKVVTHHMLARVPADVVRVKHFVGRPQLALEPYIQIHV